MQPLRLLLLSAAAAVLATGALAQVPADLFVADTLGGQIGPDMRPSDTVRAIRDLGRASGDYVQARAGRTLPLTDIERHNEAGAMALWLTQARVPVAWRNFRTHHYGEITPLGAPAKAGETLSPLCGAPVAIAGRGLAFPGPGLLGPGTPNLDDHRSRSKPAGPLMSWDGCRAPEAF